MCLTVRIALYPGSSPAEEEPGYKATSLIPRLSPRSNEKSWCLFQMCSTNRYRDDGMVEAHFAFSHCTFSLSHFILPPLSHFAFSLCLLSFNCLLSFCLLSLPTQQRSTATAGDLQVLSPQVIPPPSLFFPPLTRLPGDRNICVEFPDECDAVTIEVTILGII